jgi:hypothetical protein
LSAGTRSHPIDKAAPETSSGHHDSVARAVGAVGLFGIALIHFIDIFDKFKETPYLGGLYVALIAGCLVAARRLIRVGDSTAWLLAGGLAALTFLAYTASRSIGLPASTDDIGNWTEPLGLASIFVEGAISLLSIEMYFSMTRRP